MTDPTAISHLPDDYVCPLCGLLVGRFDELNDPGDIVARESLAYARVSPMCGVDHPGNALVVPTDHVENLYRLTLDQTTAVFDLVRRVAIAMRASYGCDGVSIRQHNEPGGDQDVWHMHVHVLPRYAGDELYLNITRLGGSGWTSGGRMRSGCVRRSGLDSGIPLSPG